MQVRKSSLAPAVAGAAVLVPAATLLVTRGLVDALLLVAVVAVLAGMYVLRRYARAQVIYRDRPHDPTTVGDREGAA